jgi:hypothetical protein
MQIIAFNGAEEPVVMLPELLNANLFKSTHLDDASFVNLCSI